MKTSTPSVTPDLRAWIVAQAEAGFPPEDCLAALKNAGWPDGVAVDAMETVLSEHLVARGRPVPGRGHLPEPALAASPIRLVVDGHEIRVLLANHPYADVLKTLVPEFEKTYGVKVNVESYDENQLSAKLMTEFATRMSTVDVFMTRPLQEGKLMYLNGWYENLSPYLKDSKKTPKDFDFADFAQSAVGASTYAKNQYAIPLVTEWEVLYYRTDLFAAAGLKPPTTLAELEAAAKKLTDPSKEQYGIVSRGQREIGRAHV